MDTSTTSMLAGLVGGYTKATDEVRLEALKQRGTQRDNMLQYLSHLASNPNVPPEHQQWALGKVQELIQADPSKKLPKVDMGELPPVNVAQPQRSTSPTLPQMTLQPPIGPQGASGGMQGAPAPPAASGAQGGPSGDVGTASNGTVNALGNTSGLGMAPPIPPNGYDGPMPIASVRTGDPGPANAPGTIVGGTDAKGRPTLVPDKPNFDVAPPTASLTLPAQPQATVVNQPPPVPISGKGQLHLLTPQDKSQYASAAQGEELNKLRQQFPKKSDEDLMHYAKTGEFPKDEYTLTPGEARYKDGKEVTRNTAAKPGEKSGFSYERGAGGEVLIKNNASGATLSDAEIKANPQAKAVYDTAQAAVKASEDRQDERDTAKFKNAQELSDQHEEAGRRKLVYGQAVDAAKKARPMVDVLDASEDYMKSGQFTPRQDLALIVRAVRAMNPGTVRLPQQELELELHAGSYGDRFTRWFDTASKGTLPDDQRQDLMNVIRTETTKTATSAAENWRDSFKGTKEEEPPAYLKRFEAKEGGAQGTGPGQFTVTDPEGGVHTFPDQASADRFKAAIGGK